MRRRRKKNNDTVAMAGWLLADLLLALAMLFFVFNTVGPERAPVGPTPTPTATATPTVQPTQTPTPVPTQVVGLQQEEDTITISVDMDLFLANSGDERARFREKAQQEFAQYRDRQAGIVLMFGKTLYEEPDRGRELAVEVGAILKEELPEIFDQNTVLRPFHYLTRDSAEVGEVMLEVYWFLE